MSPFAFQDEDGLWIVGGPLTSDRVRDAYREGFFPWPMDDLPVVWHSPNQRALLFLDEFQTHRSVRRLLNKGWQVRFDTQFERVVRSCGMAPRHGEGTWITPGIIRAYGRLYASGEAHSVEVWDGEELVGGLYGVSWGGYFAGESMFFRQSGASKVAVCALVEHLRARGARWLDCQVMTPLFHSFGAREVPRAEFLTMLKESLDKPEII